MPAQTSIALLTLTFIASAAVTAQRFVTTSGAHATAGGLPIGVTRSDGETGDPIPVDVHGTAIVTAGGAIAAGATVAVGTDGKAVAHDGDGDKHAVGRALTAATADGAALEVLLIPSAGLLVTAP